jgi:hypothetical protein
VVGAVDGAAWTPGTFDGGSLVVGAQTITVQTMERLLYDGRNENETLTVIGTANDDVIVHTPGSAPDAGAVQVNNLLAIEYLSLGLTGVVAINGLGQTADELRALGTPASDVFGVAGVAAIALNNRVRLTTSNVEAYRLQGLGGDDTFNINPVAGIAIAVEGDEPGASDVLNYTAVGATVVD